MPWVEANGVSFHYEIDGEDGPPVVLLHEIGGSLESWDGIVPGLKTRFRVFRYDQRGFGLSEKVRQPYDLGVLVDDLQALMRVLGIGSPCHVVAQAASSMQALMFRDRDPRAVASLVFCNPAPGVDPSRAEALENVAALAERGGMRSILGQMLDRSYPPELSDRATYERYRGRYIANDPVGFGLAFRMMARTNMFESLARIECPALVIAGRQDVVRAVPVTQGIAERIPGARFETIDAGHFMSTTSPGALLALLLDFWSR